MSEIWTKICGTTRAQDALAAAQLGADAVGAILFEKSPRAVTPSQLPELFADLESEISKVIVLVNPDVKLVDEAIGSDKVDLLQFHGDETPEFCEGFGVPYMKAIRVQSPDQVRREIDRHKNAKQFLLDKYQKDVPGGTGKVFDWDLAAEIVSSNDVPIVLAGGLNPENVATAISKVGPYGIDAVSGIEIQHGVKDLDKLARFIHAARQVDSVVGEN